MKQEVNLLSSTTVGQLFNFLNFFFGLLLALNCFFDVEHRISQMINFEDNIGILIDIITAASAIYIAYESINSPFDDVIITTKFYERFKTVIYAFSLHFVALANVIDNPNVIFSTLYEELEIATDGTIFDTNDVTYFESLDLDYLQSINKTFLDSVYVAKTWFSISATIYVFYFYLANKPDFGKTWQIFFKRTFIMRLRLSTRWV